MEREVKPCNNCSKPKEACPECNWIKKIEKVYFGQCCRTRARSEIVKKLDLFGNMKDKKIWICSNCGNETETLKNG